MRRALASILVIVNNPETRKEEIQAMGDASVVALAIALVVALLVIGLLVLGGMLRRG